MKAVEGVQPSPGPSSRPAGRVIGASGPRARALSPKAWFDRPLRVGHALAGRARPTASGSGREPVTARPGRDARVRRQFRAQPEFGTEAHRVSDSGTEAETPWCDEVLETGADFRPSNPATQPKSLVLGQPHERAPLRAEPAREPELRSPLGQRTAGNRTVGKVLVHHRPWGGNMQGDDAIEI